MLSYDEAITYILGLANYETSVDTAAAAARFNLDTVGRLAAMAGWREGRYVHVAGTKGKGSTAAMVESILRCAGYRTGLFTSPHLHSFRERVRVNGRLIPERSVVSLTERLRPLVAHLQQESPGLKPVTTFDFLVVMALVYFARRRTDVAIMEAGLGGRLDATNVVTPLVSVITSISYDHTQILGETLPQIAGEKAGIIKPGVPVVLAPQDPEAMAVLEQKAREAGAPVTRVASDYRWRQTDGSFEVEGPSGSYRDLLLPLLGEHQIINATVAIATIDVLSRAAEVLVPDEAVRRGLAEVRWPGRLEVLRCRPLIVTDGAHNADSARKLATAIVDHFKFGRMHLVLGTSADKDIAGIVDALAPLAANVTLVRSQHARAASFSAMEAEAHRHTEAVQRADSVAEAIATLRRRAAPDDLICVTGSLFVVAEAREAMGFHTIFRSYRRCMK